MVEQREGRQTDVEQLKGILQQFDRRVWTDALLQLEFPVAIDAGHRVKEYDNIDFSEGDWERSGPKDGWVTYTTKESGGIVEIFIGTKSQKHGYNKEGYMVLLSETKAHVPEE